MKQITLTEPKLIRFNGQEKIIRAGSVVKIDGRRTDYYAAYPIVVSPDIAEKYLGLEIPDESEVEPIQVEENHGE